MKRKLLSMLVLLMTAVTGAWANVTEAVQGDANEDGVVDVADIAAIVAVMNCAANYDNADVNTDGSVNVADIVFVTNIIAGQSATNGTGTAVITANAITAVNGGDAVDLVINLDYQTAKNVVGASFTLYLPDGLLLKGFDTPEAQAAGKASTLKKACDLGEDGVWGDDVSNDWLTITKRSDGGLQFTLIDTSDLTPFESTHSKLITIQVHAVADVQGQAYIKNVSLASGNNASLDKGNLADSNFGVNEATTTPDPPAPAGYTVSLKEGTEDAANWQAKAGTGTYQQLPLSGVEAGTAVSVKYSGRKRVRGVKAVKAATESAATDLSMVDCAGNNRTDGQWTANCYMVHTAGDYKLPLVYGNAIKASETNAAAYTGVENANTTLTFPRHDGEAITAPWIKDNGITVASAELLWQDAQGLITAVGIDGDYLTLTVGKDAATQEGNALVAAKDAQGTIVWSWHIWVTKQTFAAADLTTVATGSHNYTVTPVNLGWVGDAKSATGYSTFYQWGRKDAFKGTGAPADANVYDISDATVKGFTPISSTTATIADNIKNPTTFYNVGGMPSTAEYFNLWDAQQTGADNITTATKKTVYDPSPAGFCVPTGNLYYYFGNGEAREVNTWDDTNKGATWNLGITGNALFFPASGYRTKSDGSLSNVGSGGFYLSASAYGSSTYYARYLYLFSSFWYWGSEDRSLGYSVRAVAEE